MYNELFVLFKLFVLLHQFRGNVCGNRMFLNIRSSTSAEIQQQTVNEMLKRILPNQYKLFYIDVVPSFGNREKDSFKISSPMAFNDSRIKVSGNSGVAAAMGIMYYLKYFCKSHISWEASQIDIPSPTPSCYVKITALDQFRYYENVCTSSYSFAWWNWDDWERHIDWMSLNGINFPLAFNAQEEIWRRVYFRFNFTQQDLDEHFAGPAFLAWGRMGNLMAWGGPLSDSWHQATLALQQKILKRMRDFGMIPILPAFAGHVPSAITRIFPNVNVTRLPAWAKFKSDNYTRTYFLNPSDPLFSKIGIEFIKEMEREYNGTDHVYNCDPFNEMTPSSSSANYLRSVSKAIFKTMMQADTKAIWVLQGWMFHDSFWTYDAAKAFLTAIPKGRVIVLDLNSDSAPLYHYYDFYFGQPFIFCMLHNFGGVDGFYGNFQTLLHNMKDVRNLSTANLIGIGLTPEGINQNYVIYDFMLELGWRQPQHVNLTDWIVLYATHRYGHKSSNIAEAWKLLAKSVYNDIVPMKDHGGEILIQHRPNLHRSSKFWYNPEDVMRAWDLFVEEIPSFDAEQIETNHIGENWEAIFQNGSVDDYSTLMANWTFDANSSNIESTVEFYSTPIWKKETFKHDLVDLTRQVLQIIGDNIVLKIRQQYHSGSAKELNSTAGLLEELLDDLDLILGTSKHFLLGNWLQNAQNLAKNDEERYQYVTNALYQISLWGPNGEIVDYAVKQWNGVVKYYFKPRWIFFKKVLISCIENKVHFNQSDFDNLIYHAVEKPFAQWRFGNFLTRPDGDPLQIASLLHEKYRSFTRISN